MVIYTLRQKPLLQSNNCLRTENNLLPQEKLPTPLYFLLSKLWNSFSKPWNLFSKLWKIDSKAWKILFPYEIDFFPSGSKEKNILCHLFFLPER